MSILVNDVSRAPRSLWSLIPERVKWSLLPVFTSAFLVGTGQEMAAVLTPVLGREAHPGATGDIAAFLLLCNLLLALWVFHKVLSLEIERAADRVDLPSRFLNFAAIFVTVADLFKLAVDPAQERYVALYGVVVVLYLLVVPFFLVVVRDGPAEPEEAKADAALLRSFLRMATRTSVYGVTLGVAVAICVGIFFAIMNDGWQIGFSTERPIEAWFGQRGRNEFWLINPMLLAVPTLQLCTLRFGHVWTSVEEAYELDIPGWRYRLLVAVSIVLILLLALVMLSERQMLQQGASPAPPFDADTWMRCAQGVAGLLYAGIFFAAFFVSHALLLRFDARRPAWAVGTGVFGLAGVAAGILVLATRWLVSEFIEPVQFHLLWLHAISFVLAFLGIYWGSRLLARRIRGMAPLLPFTV